MNYPYLFDYYRNKSYICNGGIIDQRLLLGIIKYDVLFLLHVGALRRPFFYALTLLLPSMQ